MSMQEKHRAVRIGDPLVLLGVTGLARSGKDTLADYFVDLHGFIKLSFADVLKEAAAVLLNEPLERMYQGDRESKIPGWPFSIREFLQRFGTEAMRNTFGDDFWVKTLEARMQQHMMDGYRRFVIPDCRFENEAKWVRDLGGRIVHVSREGVKRMDHASEQGIALMDVDAIVPNHGSLLDYHVKLAHLAIELDKSGHLTGHKANPHGIITD